MDVTCYYFALSSIGLGTVFVVCDCERDVGRFWFWKRDTFLSHENADDAAGGSYIFYYEES